MSGIDATWGLASVCWRLIGTTGDRSCPELAAHTLCRNCPVFNQHSRVLLNRPPDPTFVEEQTRQWATPPTAQSGAVASGVLFRLGTEWLLLPTRRVLGAAAVAPIQPIPHRSKGAVRGVVNLEGRLVVCVALESLLGIPHAPNGTGPADVPEGRPTFSRLLVLALGKMGVACRVDEVGGVIPYDPRGLESPPATLTASLAHHTEGMVRHEAILAGCLDGERLFHTLRLQLS